MKKSLTLALLLSIVAYPAWAATNVWIFYGAGPPIFSAGMDVIARKARAISGVGHVSTHAYYDTQTVANQIRASSHSDKTVVVGYSCGGNAAAVIAQGVSERSVYVLGIQPSLWCGTYQLPGNVPYGQDTYGSCLQTFGLGCAKYYGAAQKIVLIMRPDLHLQADDDPNAQNDVLGAIYAIANPSRAHIAINRLARETNFVRTNGQKVWLRER
jgi:hypothetical protein